MKKIMTGVGLVLLASVAMAVPAAAQANIGGTWAITIVGPEGPSEATADLVQTGTTFTGTISVDQADDAEIEDGTVEGNNMSFTLMISVQGQGLALAVSGVVDGDANSGEMSIPDFGGFPFTARRQPR
jgi:hypothetical protein